VDAFKEPLGFHMSIVSFLLLLIHQFNKLLPLRLGIESFGLVADDSPNQQKAHFEQDYYGQPTYQLPI